MTTEELRREGFDCYGFHRVEHREAYRAELVAAFPDAETTTTEWEWHGFTVLFLGVRLRTGKVRAQAELEGAL